MIAALKFLHIGAMLCWCAGMIALPLLLISYGHAERQTRYAEFRLLTHYGYVGFLTPAAVIAVGAGMALIFAADVFDLWFAAKLAFVSGMALVHAWIGHQILMSAEDRHKGDGGASYLTGANYLRPLTALIGGLLCMLAILWLVLAKPDLTWVRDVIPEALLTPRGQS